MEFKLPEIRTCNNNLAQVWYVEYYAKNPITLSLVRKRISIPKSFSAQLRFAHGEKIVREITKKLKSGWSPFLEEESTDQSLLKAIELYLIQKQMHLRPHTIKAYKKGTKEFKEWLSQTKRINLPATIFNKHMAREHIDYLLLKGGKGSVTINKRIKFLRSLFAEFLSRGTIEINPFITIKTIKQPKFGIKSYSDHDRILLLKTLKEQDTRMYMYCCFIFYLGLRPLEITKIKKSDFDLVKNIITIPADVAKNWTTQIVHIPQRFQFKGLPLRDGFELSHAGRTPARNIVFAFQM